VVAREFRDAGDVGGRLETNWKALGAVARGEVKSPDVTVEDRHQTLIPDIPPIVRQALADAAGPAGPPLEILKLAEVANGALTRLMDDGEALPAADVVHLVVNVIMVQGDRMASNTWEVVARPAGAAAGDTAPA
jgi:hypothetical protein